MIIYFQRNDCIVSKSKDRIGPFSFDIVFGLRKTISADYTFDGFKLYSGITTYLQGW